MKKVLIGFVVTFILLEVLDILVHGVILMNVYQATQSVWRPDMMQKMWILHIVKIVVAFLVTFIFSKGYEGKGIIEGLRYGFYIGVLISIGMAYGTYAMIAIPYSLALQWFIYGVIEYIIVGVALALVFGKKATPAA
ncbi:MAG: hypothetical protein NTX44_11545 [Ignavibacteriales bacterium]|nr:hypothetical protein [Ignavibacteriales bacterium]